MTLSVRRPGVLPAVAALVVAVPSASAQLCEAPCVSPTRGAIIAAGGGQLDPRVYAEFVRMAGGENARIVLIPTAGAEYGSHDGWTAIEELKKAGVERLEILHTRSRSVADLVAFAAPLEQATGVWFSGGRQWRLVEVYLNTKTHRALEGVLERGGVIGGNSAGASALASFLLRGGETNTAIVKTGRTQGFGFLRDIAIDQHILARGRENEMFGVLRENPQLLGIGLTEGAAVVISADLARVIGDRVAIYDVTDPLTLIGLQWLGPGSVYDLSMRQVVLAEDDGPPGEEPRRPGG